jgi:hypothetical protein
VLINGRAVLLGGSGKERYFVMLARGILSVVDDTMHMHEHQVEIPLEEVRHRIAHTWVKNNPAAKDGWISC